MESGWFKHALLNDAGVGTCHCAASDGRSEDGVKTERMAAQSVTASDLQNPTFFTSVFFLDISFQVNRN